MCTNKQCILCSDTAHSQAHTLQLDCDSLSTEMLRRMETTFSSFLQSTKYEYATEWVNLQIPQIKIGAKWWREREAESLQYEQRLFHPFLRFYAKNLCLFRWLLSCVTPPYLSLSTWAIQLPTPPSPLPNIHIHPYPPAARLTNGAVQLPGVY